MQRAASIWYNQYSYRYKKRGMMSRKKGIRVMDKIEAIKKLCDENQIRMIDFKMTDIDGRWRHMPLLKRAIWFFCRIQIRHMWILLLQCLH